MHIHSFIHRFHPAFLLFFFGTFIFFPFIAAAAAAGSGVPSDAGAADPGRLQFELGTARLLESKREAALRHFRKAAGSGGQYADEARLYMIRLVASEKRKVKESRKASLRTLIRAIGDPEKKAMAWSMACQELYAQGRKKEALELALEKTRELSGQRAGYQLGLLAAQIYREQKEYAAALGELFRLLSAKPGLKAPMRRKIMKQIARIYEIPGPLFDPGRADAIRSLLRVPNTDSK